MTDVKKLNAMEIKALAYNNKRTLEECYEDLEKTTDYRKVIKPPHAEIGEIDAALSYLWVKIQHLEAIKNNSITNLLFKSSMIEFIKLIFVAAAFFWFGKTI